VNDAVLHAIRTRRVVRALTDAPVGTISSEPYSTVLATLLMPGTGDFTDTPSLPSLSPCVRCGWSYLGCFSARWPRSSYASIGPRCTTTASQRPTPGLKSTWAPRRRPCCSRHTVSGWGPDRSPPSAARPSPRSSTCRWSASRVDHLSRPRGHRTAACHTTPGRTQVGRPHPVGAWLNPPRYSPPRADKLRSSRGTRHPGRSQAQAARPRHRPCSTRRS
jgi:hypothetical protein